MISIELNQKVYDSMIEARMAETIAEGPDHECGDTCVACRVNKMAKQNRVIGRVLASLTRFAMHQVAVHGKEVDVAITTSIRIAYMNGFADAIQIANNQVLEASLTRAESRAADDTGREERTCPE